MKIRHHDVEFQTPARCTKHQVPILFFFFQFFLENVKDHPYVTGNEGSRPIIIETLKFLYDLEMIAQRDGEVATPEIARPRVPHEVRAKIILNRLEEASLLCYAFPIFNRSYLRLEVGAVVPPQHSLRLMTPGLTVG